MKKYLIAALSFALLMVSCGGERRGVNTTISGRFVGNTVDSVYLDKIAEGVAAPERIAGVALQDNGGFEFSIAVAEESPRF